LTFRQRLPSPWDRRRFQLFRFAVYLPVVLLAIRRFIDCQRVAVVNYHFPDLFALGYTIARRLCLIKVKIILTFHNSDVHAISNVPRGVHWLYRLLLRDVDAIVAVSDGLRCRILKEFPEFAGKAYVIHNGVDIARFRAEAFLAPPPRLPPRYVLSVGVLDWRKGHDILLRAFALCAAVHPDVSLILLGARGDASSWIEREVRELGLEDRVLLPGAVNHGVVGHYTQGAEIFVLASRREGFPMSILEAGAFAKPVIATAIDGIPEVISHTETGQLVMPEDVDALVENLNFLLSDRTAARRLGCALRRRLAEDFTWRKVYQDYLALCESLGVEFLSDAEGAARRAGSNI
jgi:glycosyltransferase involved in cell wall biosynthesis